MQRRAAGLRPGTGSHERHSFSFVIPAKAGIQWSVVITERSIRRLDSRFRGNDEVYIWIVINNLFFGEVPG